MNAGEYEPIRGAADVDAAWLTAVLHADGIGRDNHVCRVEQTPVGTGQMGDNVRFALTWERPASGLPASVVGKFPSSSPTSRATAVQVNSYRHEVGFYRDLRAQVSVSAPHVHHVGWDPASHDFVLLMQDLAPARQGDQIAGCTPSQAEAVIDQAVALHSPTWGQGNQLAAAIEWLQAVTPERVDFVAALLDMTYPGFVERYSARLATDDVALGANVIARYHDLFAAIGEWADEHCAWCVTHGDFRPDNVMFDDSGVHALVTVVDWQVVGVGVGPADVAYFCGAGLLPDVRAEHERRLIGRYAAGLRAAGVGISDEAVWDGYVLGSAHGYVMAVIASQIVERTERGDDMFVAMASRHADHIRTVGLLDVLDRRRA